MLLILYRYPIGHCHYMTHTFCTCLGYHMTEISELGPYGTCDGRAAPTGCSGLAIVSRFPIIEVPIHWQE